MARKQTKPESNLLSLDMGRPNSDAQKRYFASRKKYTAYGGARGGGKTWCAIRKALGGALNYPGIRILFIRREYEDLRSSVIEPMVSMIPQGIANYNQQLYMLYFLNGSSIKFGNMPGYGAAVMGKYQGQEYDWIFLEEATQLTEQEFRGLGACLRGVNEIPKRFYLTCNPGGIGHHWVKRLFVEKRFRENENPEDYEFIKATVDDNVDLMKSNPDYVNALELLPDDIRNAHRCHAESGIRHTGGIRHDLLGQQHRRRIFWRLQRQNLRLRRRRRRGIEPRETANHVKE